MLIRPFKYEEDAMSVCNLWNRVIKDEDFYYHYEFEEFDEMLFKNRHFDPTGAFVAIDGGLLVGFSCGFVRLEDRDKENHIGYFNQIFVDQLYRRQGIGTLLWKEVAKWFKEKNCVAVRSFYQSPVNWPWYIPGTDHHNHPGTPAIRINTSEYFFMLAMGFYMQGQIDAFHLPLSEYHMPEKVKAKMKENEQKGLTVEVYDPNKHFGVEEFCQKIEATGNTGFANAIRYNLKREKPYPFLIASDHGKMVGWTGPMYTEASGRGHLDGICVDPDVRGGGLGRGLFCTLCEYSKTQGSGFMTFFTGLENPARYIYLGAGFKIVQSYAIMKHDLEEA